MSDGTGGTWWRPSRLDDIYATPDRVLTLFRYYRMGQLAREQPYGWWKALDTGRPEFAHLYPVTLSGSPESSARCGQPAPVGASERTGGESPCPRCHAIENPPSAHAAPGVARFVAMQE